jgi:hypothetical protein
MKKSILLLLVSSFVLLFQGCSSKKYYEPETTYDSNIAVYDLGSNITNINSDGATLDNGKFVSKEGLSSEFLEEGYTFLNKNNGVLLSTNDQSFLAITKGGTTEKIQFDKNIVSATIEDNLVAMIFIDNSISLFDIKEKNVVFKEYFTVSILNDIRITNPIFLTSLVLFPTLDGKIVIVDKNKKTVYKTINLDPQNNIHNIIYLNAIGDTLVAATPNKIFSFVNGKVKIVTLDVKNVAVKDKNIFVSTLDGRVIKYDEQLNELDSKKFKFAKFHAMVYGDSLYILESQGYLIQIDKDFQNVAVIEFSFDEKEKVVAIEDTIYFEDNYITLK